MNFQKSRALRQAQMYELLAEQQASGLSQIQFCKNQNMSLATFSYWRQKYLKETTPPLVERADNFLPLSIQPDVPQMSPIEIELPNKIILRCEAWQSHQLTDLVLQLQKMETPC